MKADIIGSAVCFLMAFSFYGLLFYSIYKTIRNAIYKSEIRHRRASMKLIKGEKKDD